MTSQGPNSGSSFTQVAFGNLIEWNNPGNVVSSNNVYAVTTIGLHQYSNYLKATGFNFAIPTAAKILGIVVEIEGKHSGSWDSTGGYPIRMVKNGAIVGALQGGRWTPPEMYRTYGGSSYLWQETWTPADINDPDFGVVVSAYKYDSDTGGGYVSIDHIRITVYYVSVSVVIIGPTGI